MRLLLAVDGGLLQPSEAFRRYRDRIRTRDRDFERRRGRMEEVFRKLKRAGIERGDLYLAWDFTVASAENNYERLLHMRDTAFSQLGDTTLADGVVRELLD